MKRESFTKKLKMSHMLFMNIIEIKAQNRGDSSERAKDDRIVGRAFTNRGPSADDGVVAHAEPSWHPRARFEAIVIADLTGGDLGAHFKVVVRADDHGRSLAQVLAFLRRLVDEPLVADQHKLFDDVVGSDDDGPSLR